MRTNQIEQRQLVEHSTAVVRSALTVSEMGPFIGRAISAVQQALAAQGLSPSGPPFARYHRLGAHEFEVEVGFPTTGTLQATGEVMPSSLPGGHAAVMTYIGPYDQMGAAYGALAEWVATQGAERDGDPWESYFSDPEKEPDPRRWRTEIVMPFH